MRRAGLIAALALALPAPVFAHAFLQRASPAVGSTLPAAPPELAIVFTEAVEPAFSGIVVTGKDGPVATGQPHLAAGSDRQLVVSLPKLPPGTYSVRWHATSVDTHKTEGSFQFTVNN